MIVITGASSGIGEALALHYAGNNTSLALTGRDPDRLKTVVEKCKDHGAKAIGEVIDVSDRVAMQDWLMRLDHKKPIDLIIANAGISGGTGGDPNGEPFGQAREIFDVNLTGVINTIEPILPKMLERNSGQIALMSSLASFRGWPSAPAYSASKGAVRLYGESLRGALARTNVKINVICPGFVESRITAMNNYKMPFLITSKKAAEIIEKGLTKNKSRIAFPWPTYLLAGFIGIWPDFFAQKILIKLPEKPKK